MVRPSLFLTFAAASAASASYGPIEGAERRDVSAAGPSERGKPPGYGAGNGPKKPLVRSKELQASIKEAALSQKAKELEEAAYSTPQQNRVFSSPGHENTLKWIERYLEKAKDYYTYSRQEFKALYSQANGNFSAAGVTYAPTVYQYSPSGQVTANIVHVANLGCNAIDYPADLNGQIALISRGDCAFGIKSGLAGAAGAQAAVIYNNAPGAVSGGTLGPPPGAAGDYVPSVGISQENGTAIIAALAGGSVEGIVQVDSVIENRTTYNIVAQTKGGNQDSVLAVGAHSDSVFAGPGINDDGSGTIGILETALQLTKYSTNNAIRFLFWSAEEFGLLGSEHYVTTLPDAELDKIRLYLNFDMIASPNYISAIYDGDGSSFNITGPPGSAEAEEFFEKWFEDQGLPFTATDFDGRSDYGPFLDAGVPAGGIFTGAEEVKTEEQAALFGGQEGVAYDMNYHQAGDNYTNLNFEAFTIHTKAIAAAVAHYGSSFDTLPPRNSTVQLKKRMGRKRHPHRGQALRAKHVHHTHDCGGAPKVDH